MPTDEERRAVARNIRDNYARGGMGYIPVSGSSVARAIGMCPEILISNVAFWHRLADLIEPSCDCGALLTLTDEIEEYADGDGARFGRVIDRERAKRYARRIREALGVVE